MIKIVPVFSPMNNDHISSQENSDEGYDDIPLLLTKIYGEDFLMQQAVLKNLLDT